MSMKSCPEMVWSGRSKLSGAVDLPISLVDRSELNEEPLQKQMKEQLSRRPDLTTLQSYIHISSNNKAK